VTDPATSPDVPRTRDADDAPAPGEQDANDAAPHAEADALEAAPADGSAADAGASGVADASEPSLASGDAANVESPAAAAGVAAPAPRPRDRRLPVAIAAFVLGLVVVLGAYVTVNGAAWRTSAAPKHFGPAQLQVPRGQASTEPGRMRRCNVFRRLCASCASGLSATNITTSS